jgi:hypothetical protein
MKSNRYPLLKLAQERGKLNFEDWFRQGLYLPDRKFPPKISFGNKSGLCKGYFIVYDQKISPSEIFHACKARRWNFFDQLNGEFFIIFADFHTEEIFVLVDQNGKFPCYFTLADNQFVLSVDFGLVKNFVKNKSLNLNCAFDFLNSSHFLLQMDETILNEVGQIPTGTILKIDKNFRLGLKSFVDLDNFLKKTPPVFSSLADFSQAFLEKLAEIIKERLAVFENLRLSFASDLSSGFDSTLISYLLKKNTNKSFKCISWRSPLITNDSDPKIVQEFAKKHHLKISFFDIDSFFPFSDSDLRWVENNFYPASHATELYLKLGKNLADKGIDILFQGVGGDEVYASPNLELETRFLFQTIFFKAFVNHFKDNQINLVFTGKGLDYFLDHNRFRQKNYFPIIHSPSSLYLDIQYFSIFGQNRVWPVSPFCDQRLSLLCRGIPHSRKQLPSKLEIWKNHPEIFVIDQFRPSSHMDNLFNRFLRERKNILLTILENSQLGKTGLFRLKELKDNLKNGREDIYLADNGVCTIIQNLLHLELFLQKNRVKIPNY